MTITEMINTLGIEDLHEAAAFSDQVRRLLRPLAGSDDRYPTAVAVEAMGQWRLHRMLGGKPRRESRLRAVWHRDGF